ncbi:hypothetical protein [Agromyces albus]|uniref:Uncharacterized protein n=1 Tax=Agromyces albus TaxID=205332 RepID=A0A4Q2KWU4_9MICO|nr:hypothetical protein [Agromyces albus]RXZ68001.1 hypothetical protein ESP51_15205 [Agromyces albus]
MTGLTRGIELERASHRVVDGSVEGEMLAALGRTVGAELAPATIMVDGATRFEVEGADAAGTVFVQFVANQGEFKSAHRNRVSANLFKLAWLKGSLFPDARIMLCVSGTAAQAFTQTGWATIAARDLGIDVVVYGNAAITPLFAGE